MAWTTPAFDEVKMDAEIGSYQEDTDPRRDGPITATATDGDQPSDG
jgi:hypothetical protein